MMTNPFSRDPNDPVERFWRDQTTASGMLLKEILVSAGLPVPALQVFTGSGSLTGRALIEHPDLDMLFALLHRFD
jgi:hypothetical protein